MEHFLSGLWFSLLLFFILLLNLAYSTGKCIKHSCTYTIILWNSEKPNYHNQERCCGNQIGTDSFIQCKLVVLCKYIPVSLSRRLYPTPKRGSFLNFFVEEQFFFLNFQTNTAFIELITSIWPNIFHNRTQRTMARFSFVFECITVFHRINLHKHDINLQRSTGTIVIFVLFGDQAHSI